MPLDSDEEKEREEGAEPGESKDNVPKAETIRGTATVTQPGPNLAERTEQETTKEYFDEMDKVEAQMKKDLESGKFTRAQIDEIKELMAKSVSLSLKSSVSSNLVG